MNSVSNNLKLMIMFIISIIPSLLLSTIAIFCVSSYSQNLRNIHNETNIGFSLLDRTILIAISGAIGPESFAFDSMVSGPYTGISDGRIVKWDESKALWSNFSVASPNRDGCGGPHEDHHLKEHICGRPLGLCFNKASGDLYIADAYKGLLVVGPQGGVATPVVTSVEGGSQLGFTNSLDIDQLSGVIYFTDSSSLYQRRNFISVILSGDKTGKLMKYDPRTKEVTTLISNLQFPNGVVLTKDGDSILISETTTCRVLRYWINTQKTGKLEVFAELPGFPDNIKRSPRGGYWVGIHSRKEKLLELILSKPWIGSALLKLPIDVMKVHSFLEKYRRSGGVAIRLTDDGEVLETFDDKYGRLRSISEVMEKDGELWIGSVTLPFAGRYKMQIL